MSFTRLNLDPPLYKKTDSSLGKSHYQICNTLQQSLRGGTLQSSNGVSQNRSSRPEVFCKKGVLKYFAKSTPVPESFPVTLAKFLITPSMATSDSTVMFVIQGFIISFPFRRSHVDIVTYVQRGH